MVVRHNCFAELLFLWAAQRDSQSRTDFDCWRDSRLSESGLGNS